MHAQAQTPTRVEVINADVLEFVKESLEDESIKNYFNVKLIC